MAIYNAWCDRVPVYMILGNTLDAAMRYPGVEWAHTACRTPRRWCATTPSGTTRRYRSALRGIRGARLQDRDDAADGAVVLVADRQMQEEPIRGGPRPLRIQARRSVHPPQGDAGAYAETARLLVAAENPVIVADRAARTPAGLQLLIELAETLAGARSIDRRRMNFPSRHPLNQTERARRDADVVLGLEMGDFGASTRYAIGWAASRPTTKPDAKLITITAGDLFSRSNYQDFGRYAEVDLAIAADAEATLPALIEACERPMTTDRKRDVRGTWAQRLARRKRSRDRALDSGRAWDASPVSSAPVGRVWERRSGMRIGRWSPSTVVSWWPLRLWDFDKHYQFIGGPGGYGVGYGAPRGRRRARQSSTAA